MLPCLPAALAVTALGPGGGAVPAEDLQPLQLHYERQDTVASPHPCRITRPLPVMSAITLRSLQRKVRRYAHC